MALLPIPITIYEGTLPPALAQNAHYLEVLTVEATLPIQRVEGPRPDLDSLLTASRKEQAYAAACDHLVSELQAQAQKRNKDREQQGLKPITILADFTRTRNAYCIETSGDGEEQPPMHTVKYRLGFQAIAYHLPEEKPRNGIGL